MSLRHPSKTIHVLHFCLMIWCDCFRSVRGWSLCTKNGLLNPQGIYWLELFSLSVWNDNSEIKPVTGIIKDLCALSNLLHFFDRRPIVQSLCGAYLCHLRALQLRYVNVVRSLHFDPWCSMSLLSIPMNCFCYVKQLFCCSLIISIPGSTPHILTYKKDIYICCSQLSGYQLFCHLQIWLLSSYPASLFGWPLLQNV